MFGGSRTAGCLSSQQDVGQRTRHQSRHQREEGNVAYLGLPRPGQHQQGDNQRIQGMQPSCGTPCFLEPGQYGKQQQQGVEPHNIDIGRGGLMGGKEDEEKEDATRQAADSEQDGVEPAGNVAAAPVTA